MRRSLRSNVRFERAVGTLFEKFEGREDELRQRLKQVFEGLLNGGTKSVRQHNPNDATACIPLIDDFVLVVQPASFYLVVMASEDVFLDISEAETIDLLTVEQEPG